MRLQFSFQPEQGNVAGLKYVEPIRGVVGFVNELAVQTPILINSLP